MEGNQMKMREALTKLVAYLDKEVKRTAKCEQCEFNGKSFRGEPCYWHVNCGIDRHDDEASDNAKYLLKKFKLQEALSAPAWISEEYAKPKLCKSCAHYMTDGCEICGCTDYKEQEGETDGK